MNYLSIGVYVQQYLKEEVDCDKAARGAAASRLRLRWWLEYRPCLPQALTKRHPLRPAQVGSGDQLQGPVPRYLGT